mgnify:CR=1 FL=1
MQIYIFNRKEYQQVLKTLPRIKVSRIIMQIKNIPTIFTDGWYKGNNEMYKIYPGFLPP